MGPNLKITIDGNEIDLGSNATFAFATVTDVYKVEVYPKQPCSGSVEFDMNYDFSHPFYLQFEPELCESQLKPLVRISPQRIAEILLFRITP